MKFNIWMSVLIYLLLVPGRRCGFDANRSSRNRKKAKSSSLMMARPPSLIAAPDSLVETIGLANLNESIIGQEISNESFDNESNNAIENTRGRKNSSDGISYKAAKKKLAKTIPSWLAAVKDTTIGLSPAKETKELVLLTPNIATKKYYQYGNSLYTHHLNEGKNYLIVSFPNLTKQTRVVIQVISNLSSDKVESFQLGDLTYPITITKKGKKRGNYLQHVMVHDVCGCPVTDDLTKHACKKPAPGPAVPKKLNINQFFQSLHSVMQ